MLIITNYALQSVFEEFAKIKQSEGIETEVVLVDNIGSEPTIIRLWLRDRLQSNPNLKYLMIGGDETIVPAYLLPYEGDGGRDRSFSCDYYYSNVTTDWPTIQDNTSIYDIVMQDDLLVGRIPIRTIEEAELFVEKYESYRFNVNPASKHWKFIANNLRKLPDNNASSYVINYITDDVPGSVDVSEISESDLNNPAVFDTTLVNDLQGSAEIFHNEINTNDFSFLYSINHGSMPNLNIGDNECNIYGDSYHLEGHAMSFSIDESRCNNGYDTPDSHYPAASYIPFEDLTDNTINPYVYILTSCRIGNLLYEDEYVNIPAWSQEYDLPPSQRLFNQRGGPLLLYTTAELDYPFLTKFLYKDIMDRIFNNNERRLGEMLFTAWESAFTYTNRLVKISHAVFGDPSMKIWANQNEQIGIRCDNNTFSRKLVAIDYSGNPLSNSFICVLNENYELIDKGISPLTVNNLGDNYIVTANAIDKVRAIATFGEIKEFSGQPYECNFESNIDHNWKMETLNSGRIRISEEFAPFAGDSHLVLDSSENGTYGTTKAMLNLNLQNEDRVMLRFYWKECGDETDPEDGVFLSDDGGNNFIKVLSLSGNSGNWEEAVLNLDSLCTAHSLNYTKNFVIKFQQYDNFSASSDGICLDNVSVYSKYSQLPYQTSFENSWDQYWDYGSSNNHGRIGITTDYGPAHGDHHLTMESEGDYSINYADLHLNLKNTENVKLSFLWKEFNDEFHTNYDGIYFSDDGGGNFIKVEDLGDGSSNNHWYRKELNIDNLSQANNLDMNSTFVVRFQQYDNCLITNDGFAFDRLSIYETSRNQNNSSKLVEFDKVELSNYPNPFKVTGNKSANKTNISFSLPKAGKVAIDIYNIKGKKVKRIVSKRFASGKHILNWNGKNDNGQSVSSGVYFMKMTLNGSSEIIDKLMIIK